AAGTARADYLPAPSSLLLAAAAATASIIADRAAPASRRRRPAAVVPPGEVTAARRASGAWPVSARRWADPSSVWTTSSCATGRGRPARTPPSVIASATRKMYAGPDPDNPVTASRRRSGTSTTRPTDFIMLVAHSTSSLPAPDPGDIAVAPV